MCRMNRCGAQFLGTITTNKYYIVLSENYRFQCKVRFFRLLERTVSSTRFPGYVECENLISFFAILPISRFFLCRLVDFPKPFQ